MKATVYGRLGVTLNKSGTCGTGSTKMRVAASAQIRASGRYRYQRCRAWVRKLRIIAAPVDEAEGSDPARPAASRPPGNGRPRGIHSLDPVLPFRSKSVRRTGGRSLLPAPALRLRRPRKARGPGALPVR